MPIPARIKTPRFLFGTGARILQEETGKINMKYFYKKDLTNTLINVIIGQQQKQLYEGIMPNTKADQIKKQRDLPRLREQVINWPYRRAAFYASRIGRSVNSTYGLLTILRNRGEIRYDIDAGYCVTEKGTRAAQELTKTK